MMWGGGHGRLGTLDMAIQQRVFLFARWLSGWSGKHNVWWARTANGLGCLGLTLWIGHFTLEANRVVQIVALCALAIPATEFRRNRRLIAELAQVAERFGRREVTASDLRIIMRAIRWRRLDMGTVALGAFFSVFDGWAHLYLAYGLGTMLALHLATAFTPGGTPVWKRAADRIREWAARPAFRPGVAVG